MKAARGGQDVKLRGDNYNRHDNWREFLFQVNPCKDDPKKEITCVSDPVAELEKMELVLLYNTESFNKQDVSKDPVKRESLIKHIDFNPNKRYNINAVITQAIIEENIGLY